MGTWERLRILFKQSSRYRILRQEAADSRSAWWHPRQQTVSYTALTLIDTFQALK